MKRSENRLFSTFLCGEQAVFYVKSTASTLRDTSENEKEVEMEVLYAVIAGCIGMSGAGVINSDDSWSDSDSTGHWNNHCISDEICICVSDSKDFSELYVMVVM